MQTSRLCWVALAAMVCAGAGPQEKLQLNTITKVEVRGNSIEIIGDRKPNFTTFSMTDPPRLVVDFSEAIFVGVSDEVRGTGGLIAGIKTASYGSDASAIARVVIGFARNVDTDIAIGSGNKLVIKALGEGSPPVAEVPKVPAAKKPDVAVAAAVPSTVPNTESSPPVVPGTKSKPTQAAPEAAQLESQLARLETERTAREAELEKAKAAKATAEAKAPPANEAKRSAEQEQAERAKAVEDAIAAKQEAKRNADALQEAEARAANEAKRAAEQQRAERAKALQDAIAAKQEAAAEQKRNADALQEAKALAANEAKLAAEQQRAERANALQDAIAAKRAAAADRKRRAEELRGAKRHVRQEAIAAQAPTDPDSAHGDSGNAGPRRTVTFVGFKQDSTGSRVFVRTNRPVHYSVSEATDKTVVLELDNARVASKNTGRSFDTSHFDSAVAMVSTNQVPSHRVQLEIRLKDPVSYRAKQHGNEVSLEFNNPTHR